MLALLAAAVLAPRPLLLIHVMPWFTANRQELGWHWRMNKTTEQVRASGRVASHFRPLIGPYDSMDPDVLELQVGWMKIAGFDGVLADWYGTRRFWDYAEIHERTKALFDVATMAKMTIGVVYEDQSVGNPIRERLLPADRAIPEAEADASFLAKTWFPRPNWLRFRNRPAVLVFGPQFFKEPEWSAFGRAAGPYDLITLHEFRAFAQGGYDWPVPSKGLAFNAEFGARSRDWPIRIPVAFPRFRDYYEEGGQKGYEDLPDADGATYRKTLTDAIAAKGQAIQVATWNDWQEGTQIEPSIEIGMRDLIATQEARRRLDRGFRFVQADLDLPLQLYRARKARPNDPSLRRAGDAILAGDLAAARRELDAAR